MVDAVYRGNIEELLSVLNHLKKYIIAFVIVVLVLLSVIHFSKYSAHIVPLVTVSLVLLPAAYYTAVLVLKFGNSFGPSSRVLGDIVTMNESGNHRQHGLKTPDAPYPKSPTPPPSYEEATRNDHNHVLSNQQPRPWLPSTSSGYGSSGSDRLPVGLPAQTVFNVERQYNAVVADRNRSVEMATPPHQQPPTATRTTTVVQNIPSVTITVDNDQRSMEI